MCRSKVLVVLDIHLICATFLMVDFGTDNQLCVKDPLKHLTWNVLKKVVFIFTKVIHPRRLTGSRIRLQPLFFENSLN